MIWIILAIGCWMLSAMFLALAIVDYMYGDLIVDDEETRKSFADMREDFY